MKPMRQYPPILNPYLELVREILTLNPPPVGLQSIRRKIVASYAWAIPSQLALETIARYQPILEIGAGSGYWAFCLRQMGVDIIALDRNVAAPPSWSKVEEGDETILRNTNCEYRKRSLMLCWPPLNESFAENALAHYEGDTLIDIGEPKGGNTGTLAFSEKLESGWTLVESLSLPRWPGCRDELRVWVRN